MTREEITLALKGVIKSEEGKQYSTCSTNFRLMAEDCLRFIENTIDKPVEHQQSGWGSASAHTPEDDLSESIRQIKNGVLPPLRI